MKLIDARPQSGVAAPDTNIELRLHAADASFTLEAVGTLEVDREEDISHGQLAGAL